LVAISISDNNVEQELRMLSSLHGIGVILLNLENPSESEMVLPSKPRPEVDWQSVNRILIENADFKDYIELVSTYYQTGRVRAKDWNKL
ncbi:MAG TPA: HrgA protein, partial [Gammaproteobacteria bacterium]|nr:HrgA protein [Gammaproteobacteria bacterium]